MDKEEFKEVKEMLDFSTDSYNCMVDIVKTCKEKHYRPEVLKSAIDSLHKLLEEKGRKNNG